MKKIKNFFFVIIISICIFFAFDFAQYKIDEQQLNNSFNGVKINVPSYLNFWRSNEWYTQSVTSYKTYFNFLSKKFREDNVSDANKKGSILIFGCSYAYGSLLENDETFGYKLFNLTNRNVYNRAIQACGIQHMYYLLEHDELYKTLPDNVEYVIYVYIPSQIDRIVKNIFPTPMLTNGAYLKYELKEDKLKLKQDYPFLYRSFIVKKIFSLIDEVNSLSNQKIKDKAINTAIKLFSESKILVQKKYPKSKFIIIRYYQDFDNRNFYENDFLWQELDQKGFIILDTRDLIKREFTKQDTTTDGLHPNSESWDLLVPKIVEKLKL